MAGFARVKRVTDPLNDRVKALIVGKGGREPDDAGGGGGGGDSESLDYESDSERDPSMCDPTDVIEDLEDDICELATSLCTDYDDDKGTKSKLSKDDTEREIGLSTMPTPSIVGKITSVLVEKQVQGPPSACGQLEEYRGSDRGIGWKGRELTLGECERERDKMSQTEVVFSQSISYPYSISLFKSIKALQSILSTLLHLRVYLEGKRKYRGLSP
ncbi:hypothetical protein RHMOL_Rhmol13G0213600 [Rhododendron molle]|uniref:Uncharacterized protein n=1 Tax=Rhododendron molle TaxID=49168 RepID=A0ACC0L9Z7_RHOML|nr:hypothetical protein RHMOL_Rhmol13G0213600 [Rhododendron molle]